MSGQRQDHSGTYRLPPVAYWRTMAVFLILSIFGGLVVSFDIVKQIETRKKAVLQFAGAELGILSQRLNEAIALTYTLETWLRSSGFNIDPERFRDLATHLMDARPAVASLQYAPDGVVTHVVPLEGNESIIGHDLFDDPRRSREALDAVGEHQLSVAGPFELIQGGTGLIARLPIFEFDDERETFWGFATAVIYLPELLDVAGIDALSRDYTWSLWRIHPDTLQPHIFAGNARTLPKDAIRLTITIPNAEWFLDIRPEEGWIDGIVSRLILEIVILLMIAGVGAGFVFTLQKQPVTLQHQVARRTEELQQANLRLRESEERFRLVFETNPDPVILARVGDHIVIDVNRAFVARTGLPRGDVIGQTSEELALWIEGMEIKRFWSLLMEDGKVDNLETGYRGKVETDRTCLLSARCLDLDHEPCVLIVLRDITAEKEAEYALFEMDRIKTEFISTAAHELTTPLSAMIGFTELLRNPDEFGPFSLEQQQEFLDEIYERGQALNRITGDLLDISRIESGRELTLERKKTDLTRLLTRVVEYFRLQARRHTIRLDLPEKGTPIFLELDAQRISEVIENLLSNAVKYSPPGTQVRVRARLDGEQKQVEICCEDEGIGMTPEQAGQAFAKFYRADASTTAVGGLGLGLSIAKQIVEDHGGTITIASNTGRGTRVCFTLLLDGT